MLTYSTIDGDVVDDIVRRHYGTMSPEMLRAVLEANPGLADRGPVLPVGVIVNLPSIEQPIGQAKAVALWD